MYVGVTRAKERVYHITSPDVVRMALREEATFARNTFLKDKLIEIKNLVDKGELKCYNDIIVNKGDDIDELIEEDYEFLD
jgi:hypothetical protein